MCLLRATAPALFSIFPSSEEETDPSIAQGLLLGRSSVSCAGALALSPLSRVHSCGERSPAKWSSALCPVLGQHFCSFSQAGRRLPLSKDHAEVGPARGQRQICWQLFPHLLRGVPWQFATFLPARPMGAQVAEPPAISCCWAGTASAGHHNWLPPALQEPILVGTNREECSSSPEECDEVAAMTQLRWGG